MAGRIAKVLPDHQGAVCAFERDVGAELTARRRGDLEAAGAPGLRSVRKEVLAVHLLVRVTPVSPRNEDAAGTIGCHAVAVLPPVAHGHANAVRGPQPHSGS